MTFDDFFYYGKQDIATENLNDVYTGILQPGRSFFYNRQDSVGIRENLPTGFSLFILMKYIVAKWIAYRNNYVKNGSDNFPDRRVGVSQESISLDFSEQQKGYIGMTVNYINFFDYKQTNNLTIPF